MGPQKLEPCQEVRILFKIFSIYICTRSDTGFYFAIFTVTEREALEESKAKFVELQKIAVNKRKLTEKKEKDLWIGWKRSFRGPKRHPNDYELRWHL